MFQNKGQNKNNTKNPSGKITNLHPQLKLLLYKFCDFYCEISNYRFVPLYRLARLFSEKPKSQNLIYFKIILILQTIDPIELSDNTLKKKTFKNYNSEIT